ncbi:MAG TPA: hypothetical protein VGL27_17745 [Negativicutes bacterium]|jgi:hypothetical protein
MNIPFYWWVLAVFAIIVARMLWVKIVDKPSMSNLQPARKPLDTENDKEMLRNQEDSSEVLDQDQNRDANPPENRKIDATKNRIPLENIVISEIPISKAVTLGHLEVNGKDKSNKKADK